MNLNQWAYVGTITGALAGLLTLAFAMIKLWLDTRSERIREWQRVVIFQAIAENAPILFRDIRAQYLDRDLQLRKLRLPGREIQDQALLREILRLQADRLIQRNVDGRYALRVEPDVEMFILRQRFMEAEDKIIALVEQQEDKYTQDEIIMKIVEGGSTLFHEQLRYVVRVLQERNQIGVDAKGRFHRGTPGSRTTIMRTITEPFLPPARNERAFEERDPDKPIGSAGGFGRRPPAPRGDEPAE